ncbi:outer membrane protein assembly factor BamD [Marinilongibacter aquaticus]|uniref:outer membrane protein assembly factor BamD n=1 Tax=Marinilongibacter aquaticus TaxID=2975157 RepID=UPI0021BDB31D|nr:outer membrane protein assembly factor BamD [Marinilongibacter aquaticus]UBM58863.1 outer membrane protein assembly factor BamD [Marinilongibacter aquaticus]
MNSIKLKKLSLLLIALVSLTACHRSFIRLQKSGTTQEKYQAAIKYYNEADYYRANVLFDEIVPLLKGDSTAEKSQFYNAYCNFYLGQFQLASFYFKSFYSTYANSPFAEEAFYMYAYSMFKDSPAYNLDQENTLTAIDALQTFINTYPNSEYADNCTRDLIDLRKRLEKKAYEKAFLYYKTSGVTIANYRAAVIAIDNFKRDFPDSQYNEELNYVQVKSEFELAENSYFSKQEERYKKTLDFYEKFIDAYPESSYLKELGDIYEKAQKKLKDVIETQKKIDELKNGGAQTKEEEELIGKK